MSKYYLNLSVRIALETDDPKILEQMKLATIEGADLGLIEIDNYDFSAQEKIMIKTNPDGGHTILKLDNEGQ